MIAFFSLFVSELTVEGDNLSFYNSQHRFQVNTEENQYLFKKVLVMPYLQDKALLDKMSEKEISSFGRAITVHFFFVYCSGK